MTTINPNSSKNQAIKAKLVSREVIYCVSSLVYELYQKAEHFPEYEDDLYSAFTSAPDFEEAARSEGWYRTKSGQFYKDDGNEHYDIDIAHFGTLARVRVYTQSDPETREKLVWQYLATQGQFEEIGISIDRDEIDIALDIEDLGLVPDWERWETSDADDWQELCDDERIDASEYTREVFEHWIVSDWLASRLEEHGEKVLRDFFGMTVWCRTTTGQAILLDHVISEIAHEMGILEGQEHAWV